MSVVSFSSVVGKKNKTQGAMVVKGLGWDENLGGKDFDHIVLNMLALTLTLTPTLTLTRCATSPRRSASCASLPRLPRISSRPTPSTRWASS